jgi:hypothetical protein
MRVSPSIVPPSDDTDTYLVFDDFGRLGRAWRETDEEDTDRQTLLRHLMEGSITTPFASSVSTRARAGRATSRKISPTICKRGGHRHDPARHSQTPEAVAG